MDTPACSCHRSSSVLLSGLSLKPDDLITSKAIVCCHRPPTIFPSDRSLQPNVVITRITRLCLSSRSITPDEFINSTNSRVSPYVFKFVYRVCLEHPPSVSLVIELESMLDANVRAHEDDANTQTSMEDETCEHLRMMGKCECMRTTSDATSMGASNGDANVNVAR